MGDLKDGVEGVDPLVLRLLEAAADLNDEADPSRLPEATMLSAVVRAARSVFEAYEESSAPGTPGCQELGEALACAGGRMPTKHVAASEQGVPWTGVRAVRLHDEARVPAAGRGSDIDEVTVTVAVVPPHPSSYVFTDRGQSLTFAMRGGGWWLTEMTQAGHMRGGN